MMLLPTKFFSCYHRLLTIDYASEIMCFLILKHSLKIQLRSISIVTIPYTVTKCPPWY